MSQRIGTGHARWQEAARVLEGYPRRNDVAGLLTAVENGGAGRSKMVALGGVDFP
jgi:hypothetical protein